MHDPLRCEAGASTSRWPATSLWCCAGAFLALILLATVLDLDVRLSRLFYNPEAAPGWFLSQALPWRWLYVYGEYPVLLLTVGATGVCAGSLWYRPWIRHRCACAFFVLAVALGPGVIVNVLVKSLWGRPRPKQTALFGGSHAYVPWWQPGQIGGGRSLPSGHASMGYVLVASTPLLASRCAPWVQRVVLALALSYGSLLGLTRIIQGGHFVTDVLWSGCLMCGLVALLYRWLFASGRRAPPVLQEPD